MIEKARAYILEYRLLEPGDRVAVAVSGGADSVALLRAFLELRAELGIVLSACHFHHGIRGAEADGDQEFVRELAHKFDLELHLGLGDARAHAASQKASLESAARALRLSWFARLVSEGHVAKIATAHTLDDQAETVLMRLLRGAGSRGLAGIFPAHEEMHLVRPFLAITRGEIEAYLKNIGQPWREDSTNRDLHHTRNRVRHQLLPLLEREFNPAVRRTLADVAEVARAEADYWNHEVSALLPRVVHSGEPSRSGRTNTGAAAGILALDLAAFRALPLALQRQVLHALADRMGVTLEFSHVEQLSRLVDARSSSGGKRLALPGGISAVRSFRELRFSRCEETAIGNDYHYWLTVPGEVAVPELGSIIRASVVRPQQVTSSRGAGSLLDRARLAPKLVVRNWRPGDRFFPARTKAPKKLKELLEPGRTIGRVSPAERKSWPVVESAGEIVWVRGFPVPESLAGSPDQGEAVLIEETRP